MAATSAIREALRAALAAVYTDWQTTAYFLANPSPPSIDVMPGGIAYDTAMARGNDDLTYIVRAIVPLTLDLGSQAKLDTLLDRSGATSMKATLEADKTLGGVVSDLRVTEASEYKVYAVVGGTDALGVEFTVEVIP